MPLHRGCSELRPDAVPEPLPVDITLAGVRIHGWLDGVTPGGLFGWKLGRLGEWDLPLFWLRHLLLNLCATPGIEAPQPDAFAGR